MRATTFWKAAVSDRSDFLDRLIALLDGHAIRYCVIGGQAVNAYTEPVVSLDLDIAIALDQGQPRRVAAAGLLSCPSCARED